VDRDRVLSVLAPFKPVFLKVTQSAFNSFDAYIPAGPRVAVEDARANLVNNFAYYLFEMEYGTSKRRRVRVEQEDDLKFLLIEGKDFDVGVRFKKLDQRFISYNHQSERQDELRSQRCFPCMQKHTAHILLGYRQTQTLHPTLSHIALTCEGPKGLDWKELLWTETADIRPIQEHQSDFLPPESDIKPKRKKRGRSDEDKETG